MIIAIDGPAGAGKSTIAKLIAEKLNITFLNSGSFYRAITLSLLRNKIPLSDANAIIEHAKKLELDYRNSRLFLNGEDVEGILHSDAIDLNASKVSCIVPVRHIVNDKIKLITKKISIVCEGRDMTTVVFPEAEYKFYLDASIEAQARRRFNQGVSNLSIKKSLNP